MRIIKPLLVLALTLFWLVGEGQSPYFPPSNTAWKTINSEKAGFTPALLDSAVAFAKRTEYSGSRDLRIAILKGFEKEPYHTLLGPTKKRGGPAGVILKNGYIVASWGDINRVDMTFSVTKSYLSTVAGLALEKGLIKNLDDKVSDYVWDGTFEGTHNEKITWRHLLTQSSDWSGEFMDLHDWADRPPKEGGIDDWRNRTLNEPGTVFEYNDVRVNVLAYALLQVWRKPLPQVIKEHLMDKIGASTTWRWYGYDNAFTNVDGVMMQSVSGGGHSGGGIFINTLDHARFGLLFLNKGNWEDKTILSENWVSAIQQPSSANEDYGLMWWLNQKGKWEGVSKSVYYAAGFGGNFIIVAPEENMVIVTRWLEPSQISTFMKKVYEALK